MFSAYHGTNKLLSLSSSVLTFKMETPMYIAHIHLSIVIQVIMCEKALVMAKSQCSALFLILNDHHLIYHSATSL